jgi:hypothetical protein
VDVFVVVGDEVGVFFLVIGFVVGNCGGGGIRDV